MRTRLAWTAPFVLAAALVAACGNSGVISTPGLGLDTAPPAGQATPPASMAPAGSMNGEAMATFCDQWTTQVASAWPPDAAAADQLASLFTQWARSPEFATVGEDMTTVATWLGSQAGSTTASSPDANTTAAYDRIVEFATTNC